MVEFLFFGGMLAAIAGQIWLMLIIARGSAVAALLCLIVPFLALFFIQDNWEDAKPAVLTWGGGIATICASGLVYLFLI